jgi:uncharacterized protein (DUF362 family)
MEACSWRSLVPRDATVVLKPNLCSAVPEKVAVVNTDRAVTEALCEVLLERTRRIYIGESNLFRQNAWDAFRASGYVEMARHLGVELVNFTEAERLDVPCPYGGNLAMPKLMMEAEVFITIPVLKTHALTYFTGALKNQWGCIPAYHDRLARHRHIDSLLAFLHRILRPKLALMDGIQVMEGRGPVNGKARRMDIVLASRDAVALDATAMRLVGLDPYRARHVVMTAEQGLGRISAEEIETDGDWQKHATQFASSPKDWANTLMFRLTPHPWFIRNIMENDWIYAISRDVVRLLRRFKLA